MKAYLHHEKNRVEHDQKHNEILKGGRSDESPDVIPATRRLLRDVNLHGFSLDHVVDTRFLKRKYESIEM